MPLPLQTILETTPELLLRRDLCAAAPDPSYTLGDAPIYIPESDYESARKALSHPAMAMSLTPGMIEQLYSIDSQQGLLYLPFSYVVPGGRFNSMYGWDTAFAVFAWAESHPQLMREQVDNHLYQIRAYGKVMNSNRTYHLSRSQPPLVAAMVQAVCQAAQKQPWSRFDSAGLYTNAKAWLSAAMPLLESYYGYWTATDRLAGNTGLSRYWDEGQVPAPEVIVGEPGHFEQAHERYVRRDTDLEERSIFFSDEADSLTPLYYRADRAMRASGFDPTSHWGYGGLRCMFHAPVCLNALLYRMEGDMASFCTELGRDATLWQSRRAARQQAMMQYLYNKTTGVFEDYDFVREKRNTQPFANAFHAFWAGLYTDRDEAARAAKNILAVLETDYGISTSNELSGAQWDYPYGWPPLQYFAFAGLLQAGLKQDAQRVAGKYIALAEKVYAEYGALFEKYNVRDGNAEVLVSLGYHDNATEHGTFLWTAACLKMAKACLYPAG